MLANKNQNILQYIGILVLAMCLKILPLPDLLSRLNPDWVLLTLIYLVLVMPERMDVFNAWVIGILVDVLTGRMLGQQALIYTLVCYAGLKFHKRLRQYPMPQQSLFVFFSLLFAQILVFWVERIDSSTEFSLFFWMPVITGTILWPLIYLVLRAMRVFEKIR